MSESKIPFTKTAVGEFSFSYGSFFVLFLGFVKTVPMSNKFAYVSSFSLQKTFFSRTTTLSLLPLRGGSESMANINCIIVARALSNGLPRHLTCTSIGLLFQKKSQCQYGASQYSQRARVAFAAKTAARLRTY